MGTRAFLPPAAPPPAAVGTLTYEGAVAGPHHAGFWPRAGAWLVDWAVLLAIRFAVMLVLGVIAAAVDAAGLETPTVKRIGGVVTET